MELKIEEIRAILTNCADRAALRSALHKDIGFSIAEARTLVSRWSDSPEDTSPDAAEIATRIKAADEAEALRPRTDLAKAFRASRDNRARRCEIVKQLHPQWEREAEDEAPQLMDVRKEYPNWERGDMTAVVQKSYPATDYSGRPLKDKDEAARILDAKADAFIAEQQLDQCKSLDELTAKLITLDWPDPVINSYLCVAQFAPYGAAL